MNNIKSEKHFKANIRRIELNDITYPSANSLPFLKSEGGNSYALFALEVLMHLPKNYSPILNDFWGDCINDMVSWAKKAQEYNCDILALKFNINDETEIDKAISIFMEIQKFSNKTLLITGSNKKNLDKILLPKLAELANSTCIFGVVEQESYIELAKVVKDKGHYLIARTPIDINLAKELNILLTECDVSADKILIDPNMAGLGYGLDYGYSIMERIKLAGLDGDEMLNMPIVAFAGEEAWKSKEARIDDFDEKCYGDLKQRAIAWESATATAILIAGANILVLWHPDVIKSFKEFQGEF